MLLFLTADMRMGAGRDQMGLSMAPLVIQQWGVQLTPVSGQSAAVKQPLPQVDSLRRPDGFLKD